MLQLILLLLVGFFVLIKGASWLVDGGVLVAKKLRISALIIGLTIVAFGTSAPELIVNIISAVSYEGSGIGLGNIIGSNITNIGLIIGIAAILYPLTIKSSVITRQIPLMVLSTVFFLALLGDRFLNEGNENILSRADGIVMLLFFSAFIYYLIYTSIQQRKGALTEEFEEEYAGKIKSRRLSKGIFLLLIGLTAIFIGGKLVVDNAADIARVIGISEILIGLTVIAIGTSLPELTIVIIASFKKEPDIAIGGIVGSNIFNILFVLGINAVISPIPFKNIWFVDVGIMILMSIFLYTVSLSDRKITRREGILLLSTYAAYIVFTIIRG